MTIEANGEVIAAEYTMDHFQWDVELEAGIFEPNIPPDYVSIGEL